MTLLPAAMASLRASLYKPMLLALVHARHIAQQVPDLRRWRVGYACRQP
jgi:hypothetical protein